MQVRRTLSERDEKNMGWEGDVRGITGEGRGK
jgi:hypothetical protein